MSCLFDVLGTFVPALKGEGILDKTDLDEMRIVDPEAQR